MGVNRNFEPDSELYDDDYDLDDEFIELVHMPRAPKRKKTKPESIKPKHPEPWDDDWYDPADDLMSGL